MDPATIATALKVLGKVFSVGRAAYKVRQNWGLKGEEVDALASFVAGSGEMAGMLKPAGSASASMLAVHTALVMRAFGAACNSHWAGNSTMAPGLAKHSWLRSQFLSKKEEDREREISVRLRRALDRLARAEKGAPARSFDLLSAMVSAPLSSPCYQALWEAFTNPALEDELEQARLLELDDPGARLEFERSYLLAYAEAIASPSGAEVARAMVAIETARPQLLRQLLVRAVSTWKRQHVFGEVETPGVPNMPLEDIYVEPDGVHVVRKGDAKVERREPIRRLVRDLLLEHKIVIVRGDFGHGKSLTARTLASEWAQTYLTETTTSSPDLVYPVFIKCGVDFANHEPSLAKVVPRAFRNQARAMRLDLAIDDGALASPPGAERVVFIVDGLDEVALTSSEVDDLFKNLDDNTSERHRAIVFSRKGVIPQQEKLRNIPIVDVQHLRTEGGRPGGQVGEWLQNWNALSGTPAITVEQIRARNLLGVVATPIILFMAALTWDAQRNDSAPEVRAEIYERFFRQVAAGKCKADQDRHQPVIDASTRLLESLVERQEVDAAMSEDGEPTARSLAMLWLMGRIAWEGQKCARRGADLTVHEVTTIVRNELGIRNDPKAEELIRIGALLVLQADHHGGNDRILFGHKSFREFLVARYWANQLGRIVATRHKDRGVLERTLLGARLLDEDDGSFNFLREILDGPDWDGKREKLVEWANECFNDETPDFADPHAPTWRADRRPSLREAALAIGSAARGSDGLDTEHPLILRTLLASFWVNGVDATIIAPKLRSPGALLTGANLVGAKLMGANLERGHFGGAKLMGANLIGANLMRAHLIGANLMSANLDDANLRDARLMGAILEGADLRGANLQGAILFRANLDRTNLRGASLDHANLDHANLVGADLDHANLVGANLVGANLVGANLRGANLRGANLRGASLDGANLDGANLDGTEVAANPSALEEQG